MSILLVIIWFYLALGEHAGALKLTLGEVLGTLPKLGITMKVSIDVAKPLFVKTSDILDLGLVAAIVFALLLDDFLGVGVL